MTNSGPATSEHIEMETMLNDSIEDEGRVPTFR